MQSEQNRVTQQNLPQSLTPFIGRAGELNDIKRRLLDPSCRLLTLLGAGGMGKTRLAIEVVSALKDFGDGVFFVDLHPVTLNTGLVTAVADALHFPLSSQDSPQTQLRSYLQEQEMLLLLDSFEHLQDEAMLLAEWLQAAPKLKLLVTSQLTLNLQEEWLYPVGGLTYLASSDARATEECDCSATQLFNERAQQIQPHFATEAESAHVSQICQLVEGMPLAIELAATWAKALSCAEIAAEIEQNIEFLATGLRNVPERQRSIRAVFDGAWERLTDQEKIVFQRLAVFPDSFTRDAATAVSGATLPFLSAFVEQSLLQRLQNGRYTIHGLLRHYAREKLGQVPDECAAAQQSHADYFVRFMQQRRADLLGKRQQLSMTEIEPELEHIRAASKRIIQQEDTVAMQKLVLSFELYLQFCSRYLEAANLLEQSIAIVRSAGQLNSFLAEMLVELAWVYVRFGRLEDAQLLAHEADDCYRELDLMPMPGQATDPQLVLGIIATIKGNYREAVEYGAQALQTSLASKHLSNQQFAYYVLAGAALAQGDFAQAQQYAQKMEMAVQASGDQWFAAYSQIMLGDIALALREMEVAKTHFATSYTLRQEFNDAEGMAVALVRLGQLALRENDYVVAQKQFTQAYDLYKHINDRGGLATVLSGLGKTAVAQQQLSTAQGHFHQALQIATDIEYASLIHLLLVCIGDLSVQTGRVARGLELLHLVVGDAHCAQEARDNGQRLLDNYKDVVTESEWETAVSQSQTETIDAILPTIFTELAIPIPEATQPVTHPQSPALVDQLTARELEVLQLIAEGLTNRQIADQLVISVGTAKYYTSQIYSKLHVSNRTQAVARARELLLI